MASRKFRFVSPGVFLKEIDNSQIPRAPEGIGPVIIGRTRKGPAMKPYRVHDFAEFERVFGAPMPGNQGEDPWRDGPGNLAESYLPYAAKAYLSADIDSPVTVVRLAGVEGDDADATNGAAGWDVENAWGMFLLPQFSASSPATDENGNDTLMKSFHEVTLGAIFYGTEDKFGIKLRGATSSGPETPAAATDVAFINRSVVQSNSKFTVVLSSSAGTKDVEFAFADIRKNFNTSPAKTNLNISRIVSGTLSHHYWLGETFEETYKRLASVSGSSNVVAFAARLTDLMEDFQSTGHQLTAARSGWIFANDSSSPNASYNPGNQQKLFRMIALHEGMDASRDLIISIEKIRPARDGARDKFGKFDVVVKQVLPSKVDVVETFTNCNLDPNSPDYVARKIGDVYMEWDRIEKRNRTYGNHVNASEFIRVEMDPEVDEGRLEHKGEVPFGFYGPIVPKTVALAAAPITGQADFGSTWMTSSGAINLSGAASGRIELRWPTLPYVVTASTKEGSTGGYMFGATPYEQSYVSSSGSPSRTVNRGYIDYLRAMSDYGTLIDDQKSGNPTTDSQVSFKFSLDDVILNPRPGSTSAQISGPGDVQSAVFSTGSRVAGTSWSALADGGTVEIRTLLDIVDGFHVPLAGGNDGVDVTEANPFNMRVVGSSATTANSYAYASIDRAIELIRDPEFVEHNLAAMPGITNTSLTTKLVRTCESRADSLAIIDLPNVYVPPSQEKCTSFKDRVDNVTPEVSAKNLVARQINSSYGATYYPWVKIRDDYFDRDVWVPPSVVALGVMAYTEQRDEVWFAPAGFNRGGLNGGNAGLPVLQASEQLLSKDRDTLYAANINPVAQFVSEGLIIFGQKTLQADQSALDRINVRRLLIFVKKEISRISNTLLFEQNVQATWTRFSNRAVEFLKSVRTRFGLSDFRVILDETTTTPDLVDRNVMYAKILLKPARSIEFIAVDFVITNTGASFDD